MDALSVRLAAQPENVALARHLVRQHLMDGGCHEETIDDVALALTEATGNVVRHAYAGEQGDFEVTLAQQNGHVEVVVRDQGSGSGNPETAGLGLGLVIIRSLAEQVEVDGQTSRGTVVRMRFRLP